MYLLPLRTNLAKAKWSLLTTLTPNYWNSQGSAVWHLVFALQTLPKTSPIYPDLSPQESPGREGTRAEIFPRSGVRVGVTWILKTLQGH